MAQAKTLLLAASLLALMSFSVAVASDINIDVKETTLSNGMKILVLENHDAPVFSAMIRARVGAVDEKAGQTGLSHFLEHMLFKGTKTFGTSDYEAERPLMAKIDSIGELLRAEWGRIHNPLLPLDSTLYQKYRKEIEDIQMEQAKYIIKDEMWETYLKNGGSRLNASTGQDGTQFYVSLPSNRLELWALLESDRFGSTVFREFYSERDVVYEERRLRTDTQPRGKMDEAMGAAAFTASGYSHPVVGWASDIETWDHDLLKDYFHTYYSPNNLVASVVGDVDANEVFAVCEKYFGKIPRGPEPPIITTLEPEQKGERRVIVEFDASPSINIGWHCPPIGHPDNAALDVLTSILSQGRTSRFNKSIVEEQKLATRASIYSSSSRYTDLIAAYATPLQPHTCAEAEQAIYDEIDKLKIEPVSEWELQKIRNQLDADFIRGMDSNLGMGWRLAHYYAMTGDWKYMLTSYENMKKVTAADIMRVANEYFSPDERTVVTLVKTESKDTEEPMSGRPGGARHEGGGQ
ncbi:MAG: pitrilysin family protein [Candidatus Zixiibacteriota bacterium]